jgi:hypothetical protein
MCLSESKLKDLSFIASEISVFCFIILRIHESHWSENFPDILKVKNFVNFSSLYFFINKYWSKRCNLVVDSINIIYPYGL